MKEPSLTPRKTRRELFRSAGGAFVAAPVAAIGQTRRNAEQPIVDSHIHLFDPTRPQGVPFPPKTDTVLYKTTLPSTFEQVVKPFNVIGAVVIEASPWLEDNQWILDLAKDHPIIFAFVGHLDVGKPGFRDNLTRFARDSRFRGIRLSGEAIAAGLAQDPFLEDLRRLAGKGLVLDVLLDGPRLKDVLRLNDRVPGLKMIVDHMPLDGTDQSTLRELESRLQIYSKVSGVLRKTNGRVPDSLDFYRAGLEQLWNVFGPDRLVYASNWPVSNHLAPYGTVLKVVREYFETKGRAASNKYFMTNSQAFYGWTKRS